MSLEQALTENTAALREHTAAIRELLKQNTSSAVAVSAAKPSQEKTEKNVAAAPSSEPTPTASASSASSSTDSSEDSKSATEPVDYKQIQALVPKIAKTPEGIEMVKALFARYGVSRGPELKAEQYDDFYADLLKIEAGTLDPRQAEVA